MAATPKTESGKPETGIPFFTETFDATGPLPRLWKAMAIDMPMTLTAEGLRFAGKRLQAQAELFSQLAHCKSLSDAVDVQSHFVETAMSDYGAEATKVMEEAQDAISREVA
ncbi:phasin family protein [Kaustia mangrovi]|uniref:Phasin family protein n=1 Tax=Kaustia mangrovi TaxID=2593653 RepID=A0A7S8C6K2_9HYPH|nr:phasin family protein [Kaustia mangrovi]QPC44149.1 phasin family protein [Kaustia mangrovi]